MKENELRIGNYVQHLGGWCYRNDLGYFDFKWNESDWYALGECTLALENIQPIPLTEEWLLKFGFEIYKDESNYRASLTFFKIRKGYFDKLHQWQFWCNEKELDINFVHQLQNLYFALTGEELTLNT